MKWFDIRIWKWTVIALVVGIVTLAFAGCKSKEYITVPEYHTEYICRTDTFSKMDSVYLKDSVYVYRNGDTVIVNKIAYRDHYHNIYKMKHDTIYKRDSISVPYPVEAQLSKTDKFFLSMGKKASIWIVAFVLLLLVGIVWLPRTLKK